MGGDGFTVWGQGFALRTDSIFQGRNELVPKFAIITASASGNTQVVALVASKKIRVVKIFLNSSGTVTAKFQSNTTDISGNHYLVASSGRDANFCPVGIFETVAGQALNINLSLAVAVSGELVYVEV